MKKDLNTISYDIIKSAIEVHKELGPGLLESVYHKCFVIELIKMGYSVNSEVPITIKYKEEHYKLMEEQNEAS